MTSTTDHQHDWTETTQPDDTPRTWACAICPATATQCATCHRILDTHGRVCDHCVSRARNDIREIRDLYQLLPDVIAAAAGLHAIRYDRTGGKNTRSTDTSITGGTAMVMAAGGNADKTRLGRNESTIDPALLDAERNDPPSVLAVLTFWEDTWRQEQGHDAAVKTSANLAADYLADHTTWAAQQSPTWADYRADIRNLRGRLRALTGESQPPVKTGVPCPYCAGAVLQHWTEQGLGDVRRCGGCGLEWDTEARFMLAVRQAHEALPETHPDQLVTLEDARRILRPRGVRPNLLALWHHRDTRDRDRYQAELRAGRTAIAPTPRLPEVRGRDVRGRQLYRLGDLVERSARSLRDRRRSAANGVTDESPVQKASVTADQMNTPCRSIRTDVVGEAAWE